MSRGKITHEYLPRMQILSDYNHIDNCIIRAILVSRMTSSYYTVLVQKWLKRVLNFLPCVLKMKRILFYWLRVRPSTRSHLKTLQPIIKFIKSPKQCKRDVKQITSWINNEDGGFQMINIRYYFDFSLQGRWSIDSETVYLQKCKIRRWFIWHLITM